MKIKEIIQNVIWRRSGCNNSTSRLDSRQGQVLSPNGPIQEQILHRLDLVQERMIHRFGIIQEQNVQLNSRIQRLYDYIYKIQYNQLASTTNTDDKVLFDLIGPLHDNLVLYRSDDGKLCFEKPWPDNLDRPPLFISALAKSGTYLIDLIFQNLGFQTLAVHSLGEYCADFRELPQRDIYIPFWLQASLICRGQYFLGHIGFDSAQGFFKEENSLISVRNLKTAVVSLMRYQQKNPVYEEWEWYSRGYTEDALYFFLRDSAFVFFQQAREFAPWVERHPNSIIRFEDMVANDGPSCEKLLNVFSKITGLPLGRISRALQDAVGRPTHTYTGKPSVLEGVWSARVEELFVSLGGNDLNARLGYV